MSEPSGKKMLHRFRWYLASLGFGLACVLFTMGIIFTVRMPHSAWPTAIVLGFIYMVVHAAVGAMAVAGVFDD